MFAPPPIQLTRAEIERRRHVQSGAGSSADSTGSSPSSSLRRTESNTSNAFTSSPTAGGKRGWLFGGGKAETEKEKQTPSTPTPASTPQHPGDRAAGRGTVDGEKKPKTLSEAFGERPRKAPVPPRRPPRPDAFPTAPLPATPPPVPQKSPKRLDGSGEVELGTGRVGAPAGSLGEVLAAKSTGDGSLRTQAVQGNARVVKPSPPVKMAAGSKTVRRRSGSFNGKIDKGAVAAAAAGSRRKSAVANVRDAVSDMQELKIAAPPKVPHRATDSELQTHPSTAILPTAQEMSWKRRQKGETMSMLLNDGFFPVQEYIYDRKNPNISVQVPFPPPRSLLDKELPDTPSSIVPTPTELYQTSPTKVARPVVVRQQRKNGPKRRNPLAPLSLNDPKANVARMPPAGLESKISPSRLSAIPEGSSVSENTPPGSASGMSTPVATKIHLRGGSVITLSPPELTAWKQTYYLQGPIRLPKPTILPRKGSTASMDAFQEVVDLVYQEALNIPRRRSDDQIVDDICDFFDDFCFDEMGFGGDVLGVLDVKLEDMEDIAEEIEEMGAELERFATPPHEMEATPVERVIAKEIVEHTISLPPVETEETLRARGIARLSQGAPPSPTSSSPSRRASSTISRKDSTAISLLPVPETSMLTLPTPPPSSIASKSLEDVRMKDRSAAAARSPVDQGFDWDDDVQELDALSSWVAPAALPKKYGMQRDLRESKNPVKRMRRFVAAASAIL